MQQVGPLASGSSAEGASASASDPGLILLYADGWEALPAAWPLNPDRTTIGRDPTADVHLPVHAVSRLHAEIVRQGGRWLVRDLGSRNGTLVDGCLVREAALREMDELRVGDAILQFVGGSIPAFACHRIDGQPASPPAQPTPDLAHSGLVGGHQMALVREAIAKIARTNLSVLVRGESGTGKEVVARELHRLSGREGDFCAINCAALPANLIESELFGYKRGAFSGAERDKLGLLRAAHRGTLLLDEIGDMPVAAQAKLLRVLQTREVVPLGAVAPEPVDVRVISATHRDLEQLQSDGFFRRDLYARIDEFEIELVPLRERKEDLFMLLRTFLSRSGRGDLTPSFSFMTALIQHDWPYNVRELEACAKRAVALSDGPVLEERHLPPKVRQSMASYGQALAASQPPGEASVPPTREQLIELLRVHRGNVAAVARDLGKARMQVHRWLKRFQLDLDTFRQ